MALDSNEKAVQRYQTAAHAMQSGVAAEMQMGSRDTEPKHLRVGVNSALSDSAALARLLISKGVITENEYLNAIADQMESEARQYEERLSDHYGTNITLG